MRNLDVNSKIMFGLLYEISTIASVSIDASYPWKSYDKHCHKSVSGFGIVNIGRGYGRLQNVTVLISYYVAFYALYLLIPVKSFLGTRKGGTGTLTVYGSNGRVWRFSSSESDFLHKAALKFRKGIHCAPAPEIVIDRLPLGVFLRKQSPLAAAHIYVGILS